MRLTTTFFAFFALFCAVHSQAESSAGARDIALDNLLAERSSEQALEALIQTAKKTGIKDQAILEARFLFHIDRNEDAAIAAMLPEFLKQREFFKIEDSAIFSVKEDWLAVTEYVQAISSLGKGDKAAFKSHITEAFWLSPRQASAFAPQIDRLRLEESMSTIKLDFETRFTPLAGGDPISLKSLLKDNKAMILHFWSPSSSECEASMPDYLITAKALAESGIAMVSILPDSTTEVITAARASINSLGKSLPGAWIIDPMEKPLVRELRVQTLPIFILISNEGKILFNGEPSDRALWKTLENINPKIQRPEIQAPLKQDK